MSWSRIRARGWLLFLLGVFVVALALRTYKISTLSTWQDETKEAIAVSESTAHDGLASGAMVRHVQRFAQPPLSHYLQQVAIENVGLTVTGIRLHSAICGALMCVVMALYWLRVRPRRSRVWPWTFGLLAMPLCAPRLVYYGQEARPYSAGLLFSALYVLALHEVLFRRRGRGRPREWTVLAAIQVAYLLSVGFQPAVVLLTAALALSPLLAWKGLRGRVLAAWLTTFLAFLVFLPWQTIPLAAYRSHLKGDSATSVGGALRQILTTPPELPPWQWTEAFLRDVVGLDRAPSTAALLVVLLFGLGGLTLTYVRRPRAGRQAAWCTFLLSFALLFPFTYTAIRESLINYPDHIRYSITAAPFVMALAILLGAATLEGLALLAARGRGARPRPWAAPALAGALSLALLSLGVAGAVKGAYRHRGWFRKLHKVLAASSEPGDLYYSPDYRLRQAFRFHESRHIDEARSMNRLDDDLATGLINDHTRRLFIAYSTQKRIDRASLHWLSEGHGAIRTVFDGHPWRCIVITAGPGGMPATLRPIFEEWVRRGEPHHPGEDGPAYVRDGARALCLLGSETKSAPESPRPCGIVRPDVVKRSK